MRLADLGRSVVKAKLEYQSAEGRRSWRWGRWAFVVVMIALGVAAWRVSPTILRRMQLMGLQRQALGDDARAEQSVFDTRPESLPQLKRSDPRFVSQDIGIRWYIAWRPSSWDQFVARSGATPIRELSLIALRRLKNPRGRERVVSLELCTPFTYHKTAISDGTPIMACVVTRVFEIADVLHPPTELWRGASTWEQPNFFEVAAVSVDPPDEQRPSRVTYRVVAPDGKQTVWSADLSNDDSVTLTPQPLTPPPPTSQASSH